MPNKFFSFPITIQQQHLDSFGHVNNAVYLNLFEEARWDLLNKNGYSLQKIQETKIGPTILEIKIRFLKELRLHDEIVIETHVISYQKKISKLFQSILRKREVCCEAEFLMGLFDLNTRKLISPTEEWMNAIGYENSEK